MQITICPRSAGIGAMAGILALAAVWYASTLAGRGEITRALLAGARCDEAGFVAVTFTDGSQFTCVPAQQMPPGSRAEAERRGKSK